MKRNGIIWAKGYKVLRYSFSMVWQLRKSYLFLRVFIALFEAGSTFWGIYFLRVLIDDIVNKENSEAIILDAVVLSIGVMVFKSLIVVMNWMASTGYVKLMDSFSLSSLQKKMKVKYKFLEEPEVLDKIRNISKTDGIVSNSIEQLCKALSGLFIFVGSVAILCSLNVGVVVLFVIITIVNGVAVRKGVEKNNRLDLEKTKYDRKRNYYFMRTVNVNDGKEIRVFHLKNYFLKKLCKSDQDVLRYEESKAGETLKAESIVVVTGGIQMILLYLYSTINYVRGLIGISDLFMYISTVEKLGASFETVMTSLQKIAAQWEQMEQLESYLALPDENYSYAEECLPNKLKFQFEHVSFCYPDSDKWILEDINFSFSEGEKLTVVGKNGAGKTTLIKLLCRLYEPTKGEIKLNGKNIQEYPFNKYMLLLGTVFQDFKLIPFRIRDNLQIGHEYDESFLWDCLKQSDVYDILMGLKDGLDTFVNKGTGYDGRDFSGGEQQKIAIARMYAKRAKLNILDEATAAVDPISESTIFANFNRVDENKTIIFISHRMSNARLSDIVIFLDHGRIKEMGKHQELMDHNGGYADLFKMQEQYYVTV